MSSDYLENSAPTVRPGAGRLLMALKTRGPQTTADLGAALGSTGEAARQQLAKLAADGLVKAMSETRGVGRPSQIWSLTEAGHARFPDTHAELTVQLHHSIRTVLGEGALERLMAARETETRAHYAAALAGAATPQERIARLATIRSREGYMAEWRREGDDYLLLENHCPVCAAAAACQGLCRAELDLFREVLGAGATVTRTDHILAGARRCAYRITRTPSRTRAEGGSKPAARGGARGRRALRR